MSQSQKARENWGSQIGFMLAGAGSAVGLANIWRFPYIVGQNGGAAFILLYLICVFLVGLPVFLTEVSIGRATQSSPYGAFAKIGGSNSWANIGRGLVYIGFIVSAFYSVIAGWITGYFFEALRGSLSNYQTTEETLSHYQSLIGNPYWTIGWHFIFMLISIAIVYTGVQKGIEKSSKWMMPLLLFILTGLVIRGFFSPNFTEGLKFLFYPDWTLLTPNAILIALGHAFFTLSLGQGTMITYGSYLSPKNSILKGCISIALIDTAIALLAGMAIFMFIASTRMEVSSGPALLFQTLPVAFAQLPGGYLIGLAFFFLVMLAAISSEISAIEPIVSYFIDEKGFSRKKAVIISGIGAFLLGIPCALSTNLLAHLTIYGKTFDDLLTFIVLNVLIPLGGGVSVILGAWYWGTHNLLQEIDRDEEKSLSKHPWLAYYLAFCLKYVTPVLIFIIFLHASELI
ncbi:MAG: putative sodium-dependent transporter [Chlamydiales bacterium]|jgi:NSS family neurotransmitter:Na+ symporter|nr:putative sodium-dependent transporter [Chlamydiales bacterium]